MPPPMSNCAMLALREINAEVKSSSEPIIMLVYLPDVGFMVNFLVTSLFENYFDVAL